MNQLKYINKTRRDFVKRVESKRNIKATESEDIKKSKAKPNTQLENIEKKIDAEFKKKIEQWFQNPPDDIVIGLKYFKEELKQALKEVTK